MANYHFCTSANSNISGSSHFDYIMGQEKYKDKKDEIVFAKNFIPSWSDNDPNHFWKACSNNERANSRDYREYRFSLPNELSLEENIKLVEEFANNTLDNRFYYSMSIHDKEADFEKNGVRNVHCHLMFSEREIDGIERTPETFFKRSNSKNPKLGGAKKSREFKSKEKLLELRKYTETLTNEYYKKNGFDIEVSCETLEKQRKIALEKGDLFKAEMLDRIPVNLEYSYLKNKKEEELSERQKEYLYYYNEAQSIKTLSEEIYLYKIEQEKERISKEFNEISIKEADKNINNLFDINEYILTKRDIISIEDNVNLVDKKLENLEMETLFKLDKDSYNIFRKLENLEKEVFTMDNSFSNSFATIEGRKVVEESIFNYELSLDLRLKEMKEKDLSLFDSTLNTLKEELNDKKIGLEINKNNFILKNEEMEKVFKTSHETEIFETKDYDIKYYISIQNQFKDIDKQIKQMEFYSSDEMIHNSSLNTLTKGEFSKISSEEKKIKIVLGSLEDEMNAEKYGTKKYKNLTTEKDILENKMSDILTKKDNLLSKIDISSLNKIKSTLNVKYKYKLISLKKEKSVVEKKYSYLKANILCSKKALTEISELKYKYEQDKVNVYKKIDYLNKIKDSINKSYDNNLINLSKNKFSSGRYYLILKEGKKINEKIQSIDSKIEKLGMFNLNEKKNLISERKVLIDRNINLEKEYKDINDKFLNNKDVFIKTLDEVYTAKMKSYEKINDEILKLEVKYSYTESNIKEINSVLNLSKNKTLGKDKIMNNVTNILNVFKDLCPTDGNEGGHGTGMRTLFEDEDEKKKSKTRGLL